MHIPKIFALIILFLPLRAGTVSPFLKFGWSLVTVLIVNQYYRSDAIWFLSPGHNRDRALLYSLSWMCALKTQPLCCEEALTYVERLHEEGHLWRNWGSRATASINYQTHEWTSLQLTPSAFELPSPYTKWSRSEPFSLSSSQGADSWAKWVLGLF